MYCRSSDSHNSCLFESIIYVENGSNHIIKLSYLRNYDSATTEASLRSYVKLSVYDILKSNYISLSDEDFTELLVLLKKMYNNVKNKYILEDVTKIDYYIVDILNAVLNAKGFNIDLYKGVSLDDGIALFNDSSADMYGYIKYATRS